MKKITKLLLMTAIAIGMVACSNDDNLPDAPDANAAKGNTYASISIKLPNSPSTRAALTETWEGLDAIETINVFLVNSKANTVDVGTFTKASFDGIDSQGILFPNVALKATVGDNVKAYVVLNGDESTILGTLKTTPAADFDGVYNAVISEVASKLAKNIKIEEDNKDVIMMTNTDAPAEMTVKAGVTEGEAMTGSVNTFFVDVERVVSRAIVTAKEAAKTSTIAVKDAMDKKQSEITIKSVSYVVGQSNKEFFLTKKEGYVTPDAVYNHVPGKGETVWNPTLFDNTGLADAKRSTVLNAEGAAVLADFSDALTGEGTASKFVLPVTHKDANYRKGNTTFFEVTAIFTPNFVDGVAYTAGNDVFLGMKDGLFYSKRELAEAEGQKATMYKGTGTADGVTPGAIMKYVLWLNPDVIPGTGGTGNPGDPTKASMSPTVRNQVYHAHITGFKQIGLPNNPLNPDDPNNPDPDNPTDPTIPGNFNPINPIKPEDPLQTEDTYLSVQITVVPWGIHSYEINLGNDY